MIAVPSFTLLGLRAPPGERREARRSRRPRRSRSSRSRARRPPRSPRARRAAGPRPSSRCCSRASGRSIGARSYSARERGVAARRTYAPRVSSSAAARRRSATGSSTRSTSAPTPSARSSAASASPRPRPGLRRTVFWLAVTGISLYLVAPSLLDVLGSWRDLEQIDWLWFAAHVRRSRPARWRACGRCSAWRFTGRAGPT